MCEKFIEIYPGIIQCQPCSCKECLVKKQATKSFYARFDTLYEQFQLEKQGAPK